MVHDVDGVRADDFCGGILFFVADGAQFFGGHIWVRRRIESLIAAGEQHVGDVMSRACPFGECCAAEEFRVIGMGKDDEDILRGSPRFVFHRSSPG